MPEDQQSNARVDNTAQPVALIDEEKRMRWASRRGMLELDLILGPFVSEHFRELSPRDRQRYRSLMERQDQELFAWFLRREKPADPELRRIVQLILRAHRGRDAPED